MNNNDLIRRGDVLAKLDDIPGDFLVSEARRYCGEYFGVDTIPAVPQPMSAVEFLEAFSRLDGKERHFVDGCVAIGEFDIAVSAAQKWAKEHPERSEEE